MNRCNKNNKSPRVKTGTNQLLNELLALRERLDVLICMCDAELNQRQSIQPSRPLQRPCMECIDVESLPIRELTVEEEHMLVGADLERRFQNDETHYPFALEHC